MGLFLWKGLSKDLNFNPSWVNIKFKTLGNVSFGKDTKQLIPSWASAKFQVKNLFLNCNTRNPMQKIPKSEC